MILGNYHVHTTMSDGSFTPEYVVESAISAGLSEIGIADHYFTAKAGIHFVDDRDLPKYISIIRALNKRYSKRIKVLAGLEIDSSCYNSKRSRLPFNLLNNLDYVIFEYIEDKIMGKKTKDSLRASERDEMTKMGDPYMEIGVYTLMDLIEIRKRLKCSVGLVHPNLGQNFSHYDPITLAKILKENKIFIDAYAKSRDALPLSDVTDNDWPLAKFFREIGKFSDSLKECKVEIAPGTDTHSKDNISDAITACMKLAEHGFQIKVFK